MHGPLVIDFDGVVNAFCPTVEGGGIDNGCSPGGLSSASGDGMGGETKLIGGERWLPFVDPEDVHQSSLKVRATKAIEQAESVLDELEGERAPEYNSWDEVDEDLQNEKESEYVGSTWRDIAYKEEEIARENDVESFKQYLKETTPTSSIRCGVADR